MNENLRNLISHTNGNLLLDHLFYVGKICYKLSKNYKWLSFLIGILHDFGKITSYFQTYIKCENVDFDISLKNHSLLSVIFGGFLLYQKLNEEEKHFVIPAMSILYHHSDIMSFSTILREKIQDNDSKRVFKKQLEDLRNRKSLVNDFFNFLKGMIEKDKEIDYEDEKKIIAILNNLNFDDFLALNEENKFRSFLCEIYEINKNKKEELKKLSFFTLESFGALIQADREMADKLPEAYNDFISYNNQYFELDKNIIFNYVKEKFGDKDKLKNLLFDTVDEFIEKKYKDENKIISIIAPTGFGKTETAINLAFKIAHKINAKRIIYALPLTNIIEQTYKRLEDIFTERVEKEYNNNPYRYLLKYHYLAEYRIDEEKSLYETLENAEKWDSNFILTTFIQVFYTLISNKASFLQRHALLNDSVIIIDELQILSPDYWNLIKTAIIDLVNNYNCRIIFLTATKPLIFSEDEYYEVTKDILDKLNVKNRTKLIPKFDINNTESLKNSIFTNEKTKNSILIVTNTIKSSIEIYKNFEEDEKFREFNIYYLSTNLLPIHRMKVIQKIKQDLDSNKKVILVSTQVIEAGVDLDFDVGFRDITTLDSLIQTAGRINRRGQRATSPLYVISLKDSNGRDFFSYVYSVDFVNFTKELINAKEHEEKEYMNLVTCYFSKVKKYMETYNSNLSEDNPLNDYYTLDFEKMTEKFKIIDEKPYELPVLLLIDENANNYLNDYLNSINNLRLENNYDDYFKKVKELNYKRKKLIPYILNLNKKDVNQLSEDYFSYNFNWVKVLNPNYVDQLYDFDEKSCQGIGFRNSSILW